LQGKFHPEILTSPPRAEASNKGDGKTGHFLALNVNISNKKAVLPQGNRAMPQVFFSVEVRQQHSLQV